MPTVPEIKDLKKIMINRDEKIVKEIIQPKDELIQKLFQDNINLHKELIKQEKLMNRAELFEKNRVNLVTENINLKTKCEELKNKFKIKEEEFKHLHEDEIYKINRNYKKKIERLEQENKYLKKVIEKIKCIIQKFISWVTRKLSAQTEDEIIHKFEKETYIDFNLEKIVSSNKIKKKEETLEL